MACLQPATDAQLKRQRGIKLEIDGEQVQIVNARPTIVLLTSRLQAQLAKVRTKLEAESDETQQACQEDESESMHEAPCKRRRTSEEIQQTTKRLKPLEIWQTWPYEEEKKATERLRNAVWPMSHRGNDIYATAVEGRAIFYTCFEELMQEARVLQRVLLLAKQQGRFRELSALLSKGKSGMGIYILAAESRGGVPVKTYGKAAGDKLVRFWCRRHLPELRYAFDNNVTEAALTKWLQLPELVLRSAVANEVAHWNTHGSADFFETLTLYLPSNVLNLLMNITVNYYQLCDGNSTTTRTCRVRSADGLLTCSRNVNPRYDGYCSHKHWVQAQQQRMEAAKFARRRLAGRTLQEHQEF